MSRVAVGGRRVRRATAGLLAALVATVAGACTLEERTDRDTGDASATASRRQVIRPTGAPGSPLASAAVRSGGLIFVSSTAGTASGAGGPTLVGGGAGAQASGALDNLAAVLAAAGATLADVVRCTVYLVDVADAPAVDAAWRERFPLDPPARSTVAVSALGLGALVELECVAAAP